MLFNRAQLGLPSVRRVSPSYTTETYVRNANVHSLFGVKVGMDDHRFAEELTRQLAPGFAEEGVVACLMGEHGA